MRWLVLLAFVAAVPASARDLAIPELSPPVRRCAHAPTFGAIERCLKKFGTPLVEHSGSDAKVVHVADEWLLYVMRDRQWRLAGVHEQSGTVEELLAVEPLVVGRHAGHRLDFGQVMRERSEVILVHSVELCGGDTWQCSKFVLRCDELERGRTVATLHGVLQITDNQARVVADERFSGRCGVGSQSVLLGWSQ